MSRLVVTLEDSRSLEAQGDQAMSLEQSGKTGPFGVLHAVGVFSTNFP